LKQLRKEALYGERNLKKSVGLLCERNEVKFEFIKTEAKHYPAKVMLVSRSAYYAWLKRPANVISAATLNLYR
jgi:hypothetical protein